MSIPFAVLTALTSVSFVVMAGPAFAQTTPAPTLAPPLSAPPASSSVMTLGGPGLVTGTSGATQSIMIPGSPVNGMMLNNGNGTSTIMVPGGPSQLIPTPR